MYSSVKCTKEKNVHGTILDFEYNLYVYNFYRCFILNLFGYFICTV